jgi:hypothetical protein
MGMLTNMTHSQLRDVVSSPPRTRPSAAPRLMVSTNMVIARARCAPGLAIDISSTSV